MSRFLIAALFVGLATGGAMAQQAAPDAAAPSDTPMSSETPPPDAGPAPGAPGAKRTAKEVREQCRADAESRGLKGPARKADVDKCFAAAKPQVAKMQQCRAEGKAKGLQDPDLKAFVQQCRKGAQ